MSTTGTIVGDEKPEQPEQKLQYMIWPDGRGQWYGGSGDEYWAVQRHEAVLLESDTSGNEMVILQLVVRVLKAEADLEEAKREIAELKAAQLPPKDPLEG